MGTTEIAMTAHLVMPDGHPDDAFFKHATVQLPELYDIDHVTLQVVKVAFTEPCG